MKLISKIAIIATFLSSLMHLNASQLDGLNIGLGVGIVKSTSNWQANIANFDSEWDKTSVVSQIDASYHFQITSEFLLGFGISYDLNNPKYASSEGTYEAADARIENHKYFYIQPSFALSETSLIFAKLGYHKAVFNTLNTPAWSSERRHIHGFGYGAGYKKMLSENIYLQAELQYIKYKEKEAYGGTQTFNNKSFSEIFSIGYRF